MLKYIRVFYGAFWKQCQNPNSILTKPFMGFHEINFALYHHPPPPPPPPPPSVRHNEICGDAWNPMATYFRRNQKTRKFRTLIYLIPQAYQVSVKLKNFFFDHPSTIHHPPSTTIRPSQQVNIVSPSRL